MSDFEPRPKGTVMYGAFDAFAPAERALRVLKNAGYARAAFEAGDAPETVSDEPTVLVVDAAATGALRAAEILEEFGAHIRFATHVPLAVQPALAVQPTVVVAEEPLVPATRSERKPRVRKRARLQVEQPSVPASSEPLAWENVIIVTRPIESLATDS